MRKIILAIGSVPSSPIQNVRSKLLRKGHKVIVQRTEESPWDAFPNAVLDLVTNVQGGEMSLTRANAEYQRIAPEGTSLGFNGILAWFKQGNALRRAEQSVEAADSIVTDFASQFHFRSMQEGSNPLQTMAVIVDGDSLDRAAYARIRRGFTEQTYDANRVPVRADHYAVPDFWWCSEWRAYRYTGLSD